MPGRDGDLILWYESAPHHRIGAGLLDGNLQHALDQLMACIASSGDGLDDPTAGTWYCERLRR